VPCRAISIRRRKKGFLMLIAEELLLLALNPHTGRMRIDAQPGLPVALAGALIGELGLEGALDVQGRRFIATGARPPHPLLAAAQQALTEPQGKTCTDQLRRLDRRVGKLCPLPVGVPAGLAQPAGRSFTDQLRRLDGRGGLWPLLIDGLVAQGVLGRRRDRILLVGVTRHPVLRPAVREEVLHRVQAAATGDGALEPRTAVLLALSAPAGLLKVVAPQPAGRDHAQRRISTAAQLVPAAAVVQQVLAQMRAAAASAAIAGGAAAGTCSGGGSC
jgi:Golgi phosphoprotein 3 (GPP34)